MAPRFREGDKKKCEDDGGRARVTGPPFVFPDDRSGIQDFMAPRFREGDKKKSEGDKKKSKGDSERSARRIKGNLSGKKSL
ncbi:MAG: hypothetical protein BGO28_06630 [Alphaproteobacteria bacterium 43-37]|nr:MAG: hypothetical protein BGO28_06630 [Alphaproteobacteria bacterium 43-37]